MEREKKQWQLALITALGVCLAYHPLPDAREPVMEKCYGVVKKGMNDCSSTAHSCAKHGVSDQDPEDWVYVPIGTCNKIMGGKLR